MRRVALIKTIAVVLGLACIAYADLNGSALQALAPVGVLLCFCLYVFAERFSRFKENPEKYVEETRIAKEQAERRDFERDSSLGD